MLTSKQSVLPYCFIFIFGGFCKRRLSAWQSCHTVCFYCFIMCVLANKYIHIVLSELFRNLTVFGLLCIQLSHQAYNNRDNSLLMYMYVYYRVQIDYLPRPPEQSDTKINTITGTPMLMEKSSCVQDSQPSDNHQLCCCL